MPKQKLKFRKSLLRPKPPRLAPPQHADEAARSRHRYQKNAYRAWYQKAEWKRLRLRVLDRDEWTCQRTGAALVGPPNAPNSPVVHHRKAHKGDWGLFLDPDNCEAVSKQWHDTEGQKEDIRHGGEE